MNKSLGTKSLKKSLGTKSSLGQFFTTNETLQDVVKNFILNKPEIILEPSVGRGDLVNIILEDNPKIIFDMYEIDDSIDFLTSIHKDNIVFGDFLKLEIDKKYKTIIGNPPYVRTTNGNLYIDFTQKCYNLLEDDGEIIFIVPSDFLKLTSSSKIINEMMNNGTFTHIYHPHDENLFEDASIDVIVFRYQKNKELEKILYYNDKLMYVNNSNGLITFHESLESNNVLISDYFDIYVGIVSGKEEVFKNNEYGNVDILNGENKKDRYILIKEFPTKNKLLNEYLLKNKEELINRKIRTFNESNWFEFGALRNISSVEKNLDRDCIYLSTLTRNKKVAFIDKVQYFGGGLIALIPKYQINLKNVEDYFNSVNFKNNFLFSGRFKIGHRQISNSYISYDLF
jgi:adenine-specific DNA-methyltransferase